MAYFKVYPAYAHLNLLHCVSLQMSITLGFYKYGFKDNMKKCSVLRKYFSLHTNINEILFSHYISERVF
jgi:hypothetical protein